MDYIKLTIELTPAEAEAFAQFLKRAELDDFKRRAINQDEAVLMKEAASQIQEALADSGHAPR